MTIQEVINFLQQVSDKSQECKMHVDGYDLSIERVREVEPDDDEDAPGFARLS